MAGVSRATVSRVVNGSPKVSRRSGGRSKRPSSSSGTSPTGPPAASSPAAAARSRVVITEPTGRLFTRPVLPASPARDQRRAVSARDLQLVLLMPALAADDAADRRTTSAAGHVDGALLVSLHGDDPLPDRIAAARHPGGRRRPAAARRPTVSYVDVDNRGGARTRGRAPHRLGRRAIATIAGPADMGAGVDRLAGYRDALTEAGLAGRPEPRGRRATSPRRAAPPRWSALLAARPDIDAVFAASDLMAAGAIRSSHAAGRRVPEDVAVVGYRRLARRGDRPTPPSPASASRSRRWAARWPACSSTAVEGDATVPRRVILATELIRRASSAGRRMP